MIVVVQGGMAVDWFAFLILSNWAFEPNSSKKPYFKSLGKSISWLFQEALLQKARAIILFLKKDVLVNQVQWDNLVFFQWK